MENKRVPKMVKCNLRGLLLSRIDGVPLTKLLSEYNQVLGEQLDFRKMGFSNVSEFLNAVPDVARTVEVNRDARVFGIALNDLNITARKGNLKLREINSFQTGHKNNRNFCSVFQPPAVYSSHTLNNSRPVNVQKTPAVSLPYDGRIKRDFEVRKNMIANSSQVPDATKEFKAPDEFSKSHINSNRDARSVGRKREDNPRAKNPTLPKNSEEMLPKSMSYRMLSMMYSTVCPSQVIPLRKMFPLCIDILVTHVEPLQRNYFWGIVINPFDPVIDVVLSLDRHKNHFRAFSGERRAVAFCENYYSRVWIKSTEGGMAAAFMVDFGNSLTIPVHKLQSASDFVWNAPPLAIPFRHDVTKDYDIERNLNKRYRCWLKDQENHVLNVSNMTLLP